MSSEVERALGELVDAIINCGCWYDIEGGQCGEGPLIRALAVLNQPVPQALQDWLKGDDYDYFDPDEPIEDPPLYQDGELAGMITAKLQKEWQRQCRIHDHGVDTTEMNSPTIEWARARMSAVERELKRRGAEVELEE